MSDLSTKEKREQFVLTEIAYGVPRQIIAMRRRRQWSQGELATLAGLSLRRIRTIEAVGRGAEIAIPELCAIANAFDVALIIRFVPFSELLGQSFDPETFDVQGFDAGVTASV